MGAEVDGADRGGNPVAPNSVDSEVIGSRETADVYRSWSRATRTRLHGTRHSECLESCSAGIEVVQNLATIDENREHGEIHATRCLARRTGVDASASTSLRYVLGIQVQGSTAESPGTRCFPAA